MINELLKPCPFCSSEKIYDNTVSNEYGDFPSNYCHECLSSSPIWNTRASNWVAVNIIPWPTTTPKETE